MAIANVKYTCNVSREQNSKGEKIGTTPLTMTFNFAGVTESQLVNEAIRNIVVKLQGKMRASTTRKDKPLSWAAAVAQFNNKTINVAEALKSTRSRKSPEKRKAEMVRDVSKLDDKGRAELLKALQASMK